RATAGVESISTPSISKSSARQLIVSTGWMIKDQEERVKQVEAQSRAISSFRCPDSNVTVVCGTGTLAGASASLRRILRHRQECPCHTINVRGITGRTHLHKNRPRHETKKGKRLFLNLAFLIAVALAANRVQAQRPQETGRSLGKVSAEGNLIVMELDEGVLGKANLFDLVGHTLRFIPDGQGYRVDNVVLQWDREFGAEISGFQVSLHNFKFPFSGKQWDALSIGRNGSLVFGERTGVDRTGEGAGENSRGGGVSIGRFDQLSQAAHTIINTV